MIYVKIEKIDRIKVNRKTLNKKRIRKLIPFFWWRRRVMLPSPELF